ncbi:recombinase family protein [Terasakiella sp. SH-1]|uniref:recombinase family protein n=1 Tax=Terasakiella sp. SH-1 TaxID=2560057 RepID=UPI001073E784|nr:recombinase family protein [Terasakiella sp. SH-1]
MKLKYLFPALFGCLISLSVMAQTAGNTEEKNLSEEVPTTALVEILTAPHQIVNLPEQAVQIDMSLLNIPSGAKDLAEGVVAKGYARSVEVEGQKIGQVVLVGVAKGDKSEPLDSQTFSAQFEMNDDNIKPDQPIKIMGDGQQLIEALKRLQEEPQEEETEEQQTVQTPEPDSSSQGENGNAQAAGYTSPDPIEKKEEGETEVKYTTNGCGVRVDEGKLQAIQQTMAQTYKGGSLESESACMDGDTVFALEKSYKNCAGQDIVDLTATPPTATAQFQYYYVNTILGSNQTHGECQPDPEMVFNIVEKHGACMISLDYTPGAEKAVFQSQLVYMNSNNVETQVRGCEASVEKPAVLLVRTTSGCNLRHDFGGNKSYRQAVWTYQDNGTTYQAGGCQDDGTEYDHVKTYKDDAGKYLCTPIQNGNSVTLQGITDLINAVIDDGIDLIITEDLSRLSRDQGDIANFYKKVTFLGAVIESIEEGAISELHIGLKGTMNALQLKMISDKTRRGGIASAQRGTFQGGRSYGYKTVKKLENGELVPGLREIDQEEADIVKKIFDFFLSGQSLKEICDYLNKRGIPSPRGKQWRASALTGTYKRHTGLLRNSMYMGEMTYNKMRYVKHPSTGKKISRMNPPEEWVRVPVPELAIISKETFEEAQKRIEMVAFTRKSKKPKNIVLDPQTNSGRPFKFARYITSGVTFCGSCISKLQPSRGGEIKCKNQKCQKRNTPYARLDVLRTVVKEHKRFTWQKLESYNHSPEAEKILAKIDKMEAKIREEKERSRAIINKILSDVVPSALGTDMLKEINDEIRTIEGQVIAQKRRLKIIDRKEMVLIAKKFLEDIDRYYETDSADAARRISNCTNKIILKNVRTVRIEYNLVKMVELYLS